jgi:hypothetical protein
VSGLRLSAEERERLAERARDPEGVAAREREAEQSRLESRRLWGALMVSRDVDTWRSVCSGNPVRARNLDRFVLRRTLRGAPLPRAESYIVVTSEMFLAIDEAGPLPDRKARRR